MPFYPSNANKCVTYFKYLVCSIFFDGNYHCPNSSHVIRRVFRIPWRTDLRIPRRTIDINLNSSAWCRSSMLPRKLREIPLPLFAYYPLQLDFAPYLLLPLYPTRKNHVEMALNYTNPIEIRHPDSATCKFMQAITSIMFSYHSRSTNLDNSFLNYNYIENYILLKLFHVLLYYLLLHVIILL